METLIIKLIATILTLALWLVKLPYYIVRAPFLYYQDKKYLKNLKPGDSVYYHKEKHLVKFVSADRKRVTIECKSLYGSFTHGNIPINLVSKFKL